MIMTGFEPRTSDIGRDRSANWATYTGLFVTFYPIRDGAQSKVALRHADLR